jgi:hypothetical protein
MMKGEYSLYDLFDRKIKLTIMAGNKLGFDFTKKFNDKIEIERQVRLALDLANKWSKEEKWVCVKKCKDLRYKVN